MSSYHLISNKQKNLFFNNELIVLQESNPSSLYGIKEASVLSFSASFRKMLVLRLIFKLLIQN